MPAPAATMALTNDSPPARSPSACSTYSPGTTFGNEKAPSAPAVVR
jgi:hypothetical protein